MAQSKSNVTTPPGGTFAIGGGLPVNRLGYGSMRITGPGIWGQPKDREEAKRVLRRQSRLASTSSIRPTPTAEMKLTVLCLFAALTADA
jgi:pyridoxine 4-dehydrogenase